MKKITYACAVVASGLLANNASAAVGWPTVNMNDAFYYNAYFGSMGSFTNSLGKQNSAVKGAVDSVRTTGELQIKQAEQNQHDSDVRLRMALGQADIARRDFEQMPTLAQCRELSQGAAVGAALSSAADKRGGGAGPSSPRSVGIVTNPAATASDALKQKPVAGTCTPEMAGAIPNCPGPAKTVSRANQGDPAAEWKKALENPTEATKFLGADFIPYGILGNANGLEKIVKTANFANYTMDQKTFETVADKYASDNTLALAPRVLETKEAKERNPLFFAKYYNVLGKLNAANYVLRDIAMFRLSPGNDAFLDESIAGKAMKELKEKYATLFPTLKVPEAPSFYEVLRFKIYNDMYGDVADMTGDAADTQEAILRKIAMNNLLQLRNMENIEKTNILLSHILVQLTTPVSVNEVNSEAIASETKK